MRFLKKYLPTHQSLKKNNRFRWISHWFVDPQLWHFNRRSVASGVAVGLFAAIMPLPFQMVIAALLAIFLHGNIPIAIVMTWVTNPFTMLPVMYLIYKVGSFITGERVTVPKNFSQFQFDLSHLPALWQYFVTWFTTLGKSFFVGLPIVALGLALAGYVSVYLIWYLYVHCRLYYRQKRQKVKKGF